MLEGMSTHAVNYSLVEIGFPTRDRWDEVRMTLMRLRDFGLDRIRTIIFDDGSAMSCPFDVREICAGAELHRFTTSEGLIVRRNQIARMMTAKYYFGLDDDSFPASGSLSEAITFAERQTDLFSLAFPIYNPRLKQYQVRSEG